MRAGPTIHRWLLASLIAAHVLLGVWYGIEVPLWEAPDEPAHYQYAWFLATERHLPTEEVPLLLPRNAETNQPPVYYAAGALLIPLLGPEPVLIRLNPYYSWGPGPTGTAVVFHGADEWFPYREWVLSAHWMRTLSALFNGLTVWAIWRLARSVLPARPGLALGAAALAALRPGFLATSASISNDATVAALGSIVFVVLVETWRRGVTPRRSFALGASFGLALVSKESALVMAPVIWAWPLWLTWRQRGRPYWRDAIGATTRNGLIVAAVTAVVGGWWFVRNTVVHGEPIQHELTRLTELPASALSPLRVGEALAMYNATFWGSFGWQQLVLPAGWNAVLGALLASMVIGTALAIRRERRTPRFETLLWLLTAVCLFVAVTEVRRQLSPQPGRDHARFWLPAIAPLSLLLWLGLVELTDRLRLRALPGLVVAGLAVLAVATPILVIRPNFPEPAPVRPSIGRWSVQQPVAADFGQLIRLAGYDAPAQAAPGQTLDVALYWEMLGPAAIDHSALVHLVDAAGGKVAQGDGPIGVWPYGTSQLLVGEAVRSRHPIRMPDDLAPGRYTLMVGVYPTQAAEARLPVLGRALGVASNAVRLASIELPGTEEGLQRRDVVYGGVLKLAGVRVPAAARSGAPLDVDLEWETLGPVARDYQVFVHLVDGTDRPRAQSDGPLEIAEYPVSRWQPGELIRVRRSLPLDADYPPGQYRLLVGLYDPKQPAQRLPITASDVASAADAARVGQVEVRP